VSFETAKGFTQFEWAQPQSGRRLASGWVRCTGSDELTWSLEVEGRREATTSSAQIDSIRAALTGWLTRFPSDPQQFTAFWVKRPFPDGEPIREPERAFGPEELRGRG